MTQSRLHMIEASGAREQDVTGSLTRQRKDISSRLVDAGVSGEFEVHHTKLTGKYTLSEPCGDEACATEFTVETQADWGALRGRAQSAANGGGLDKYDTRFSAQQYLDLNADQREALKPQQTQPTAGDMYGGRNSASRDLMGYLLRD